MKKSRNFFTPPSCPLTFVQQSVSSNGSKITSKLDFFFPGIWLRPRSQGAQVWAPHILGPKGPKRPRFGPLIFWGPKRPRFGRLIFYRAQRSQAAQRSQGPMFGPLTFWGPGLVLWYFGAQRSQETQRSQGKGLGLGPSCFGARWSQDNTYRKSLRTEAPAK